MLHVQQESTPQDSGCQILQHVQIVLQDIIPMMGCTIVTNALQDSFQIQLALQAAPSAL